MKDSTRTEDAIYQIETQKKQHDAIEKLAEQVTVQSRAIASELDSERIAQTLTHLDGILKSHLAAEDTFLYPAMEASPDAEAAMLAKRYSDEMGDLIDRYLAFAQRWSCGQEILVDPEGFRSEWQTLLCALSIRIDRENNVLYPLAGSMYDEAVKKTA